MCRTIVVELVGTVFVVEEDFVGSIAAVAVADPRRIKDADTLDVFVFDAVAVEVDRLIQSPAVGAVVGVLTCAYRRIAPTLHRPSWPR
ncbi:MAG: hypothetical protein R3F19_06320 [Verrucomicrobiales bacterium]